MKKLLLIVFILVLSACSSPGDQQSNHFNQYDGFLKTIENNTFVAGNDFDIQARKTSTQDNQFSYEITIANNQPIENMTMFIALAKPQGMTSQEILFPNVNLIEEVDLTSFFEGRQSIMMVMLSDQEISQFTVYIEYIYNEAAHLVEQVVSVTN